MAGGSLGGNPGEGSDAVSSSLRNFPLVGNSPNAQASPAGANPQAQSLSQLQMALQKLGAGGPQGQPSPAMQTAGLGQQMMQMGGQQPRPQMPIQRPASAPMPMQAAQSPQMPGMGMQQGGMTPQMMNMLLARQNGLMG